MFKHLLVWRRDEVTKPLKVGPLDHLVNWISPVENINTARGRVPGIAVKCAKDKPTPYITE